MNKSALLGVQLDNIGKKFGREWIFRGLNYNIAEGQKLLVSGGNGSGKSTLLQIISGYLLPSAGTVTCKQGTLPIAPEHLKDRVSLASPYLQLIEDFTPLELLQHLALAKKFRNQLSPEDVLALSELTLARHKFIRQLSSGMKQRLKLAIAILSDTPLLLLDEPVSNLDRNAIDWYQRLMGEHAVDRTIVVCSNAIRDDYFFCDTELRMADYK